MPRKRVKARTRHAHAKASGIAALGGYDYVLAQQGGGCAICGRPPKPGGRRLAVDHCHATGVVRSLLCHRCNRAIGWLGDTSCLAYSAYLYLAYGAAASCLFIKEMMARVNETSDK